MLVTVSRGRSAEGRAFVFPGHEALTGVLPVGELLRLSAIDDVLLLGGADADPAAALDTRGFVRPVWRDGRLTLLTRPARGGLLVPFEQPEQTPCCAAHG